jgi:SagB-type dehydrogenase family enzyme
VAAPEPTYRSSTKRMSVMSAAAVREYHEATKHSPWGVSRSPYGLEWTNKPDLFKTYPDLNPVAVPDEPPGLARLLSLGAGVHPRRGDPHFRTFMSAGALHPVEVYLALQTGVWHFHPGEGTVRQLREEDPRTPLARSAAAPELEAAEAVLALTGILWRTAWKYGARGWRHLFWDAGTMLANLLALAEESGLDPRLLVAFVDAEVDEILGLDSPREASIALLGLGRGEAATGRNRLPPVRHESPLLSPREHRFPEADDAQAVSSLESADAVQSWREAARSLRGSSVDGGERGGVPADLEATILRRGSARDFTLDPIPRRGLAAALAWAAEPVRGDLPTICSTFVVAHAVDSLEPAAFRFSPPDRFDIVRSDVSRRQTAHLCLDQILGGKAAATILFTADLDRVLGTLGGRGYRAAQIDAGIRAGRVSLAAYARGLGATGLTFYDDEARRFLDTEEEPMMCVAVGVDALRPGLRAS